ncbi:hypothetical protein D9619_008354 [Psilocybe cf. subviscida]|uniref:Uncharacterized protein n=1 Tax=Psilocybe cf. subviscida TaxID=2480587 RepID=A0A8H5F196_9AGAR|nr:hypothetical protein D9619_008354 [Psilocybe cf. subviscida]
MAQSPGGGWPFSVGQAPHPICILVISEGSGRINLKALKRSGGLLKTCIMPDSSRVWVAEFIARDSASTTMIIACRTVASARARVPDPPAPPSSFSMPLTLQRLSLPSPVSRPSSQIEPNPGIDSMYAVKTFGKLHNVWGNSASSTRTATVSELRSMRTLGSSSAGPPAAYRLRYSTPRRTTRRGSVDITTWALQTVLHLARVHVRRVPQSRLDTVLLVLRHPLVRLVWLDAGPKELLKVGVTRVETIQKATGADETAPVARTKNLAAFPNDAEASRIISRLCICFDKVKEDEHVL